MPVSTVFYIEVHAVPNFASPQYMLAVKGY